MRIIIKIEERTVELRLLSGAAVVDFYRFQEEYQLSEKLLPEIDRLISKNKLKTEDIEKIEVESDLGDNFTTYRIAKIVADSFNWAKNHK